MRIVTMCTKYVRTATGLTDCPRNINTSTTLPVQRTSVQHG